MVRFALLIHWSDRPESYACVWIFLLHSPAEVITLWKTYVIFPFQFFIFFPTSASKDLKTKWMLFFTHLNRNPILFLLLLLLQSADTVASRILGLIIRLVPQPLLPSESAGCWEHLDQIWRVCAKEVCAILWLFLRECGLITQSRIRVSHFFRAREKS